MNTIEEMFDAAADTWATGGSMRLLVTESTDGSRPVGTRRD